MDWMRRLSAEIGRPVTFAMLQVDSDPTQWRDMLEEAEAAVADGADVWPQIAGRPSYIALKELAFDERIAKLREPAVRARILSEEVDHDDPLTAYVMSAFHKLFVLGDPPDYEPGPEKSVAAIAKREGRSPQEVLYDLMLERDGRNMLLFPLLNYSDGNCDPIYEMIHHPRAALGLGDGGAHCGLICDASIPTFMLSHWVRDRKRGPTLPVELAVRRMTSDTARLYGLEDRGFVRPGYKADLNVIDLERVELRLPEMAYDLPAGGRRLLQRADGYTATIVSGEVVMENGEPTGTLPGRLIRGAQPAPAA